MRGRPTAARGASPPGRSIPGRESDELGLSDPAARCGNGHRPGRGGGLAARQPPAQAVSGGRRSVAARAHRAGPGPGALGPRRRGGGASHAGRGDAGPAPPAPGAGAGDGRGRRRHPPGLGAGRARRRAGAECASCSSTMPSVRSSPLISWSASWPPRGGGGRPRAGSPCRRLSSECTAISSRRRWTGRGSGWCRRPQGFRRGILREAHDKARRDGFAGTDDAMLVERLGGQVAMVAGLPQNLKVTSRADLSAARRWVRPRA